MSSSNHSVPLWTPDVNRIEKSRIRQFIRFVEDSEGVHFADYCQLHRWSVEKFDRFWNHVWDFAGIISDPRGDVGPVDTTPAPGATWYPDTRLNFAENLLRNRGTAPAIIFQGEDRVSDTLSFDELYVRVGKIAKILKDRGVRIGDRVAGFLPNVPDAVAAMLATTSLGAVWSSCSPDFGVQGVLDRFGQIRPKVLFTADGYFYNGKAHDSLSKVAQLIDRIPEISSVLVVSYMSERPDVSVCPGAQRLNDLVLDTAEVDPQFVRLPFNHPLYIMYSSGTTGVPKCIIHGAGGSLIQHLKEHQLHTDVKQGDRLFFFTTCGWMMWNWLVSGLASGATLMLYDGSPFYPGPEVLFDFADQHQMTIFGTSAKYIEAAAKAGMKPRESHCLDALKTILSTGSPLVAESFDYVYRDLKTDLCLSSISGGTDILSCFAGGNPTLPVYSGEIQCLALGMDVCAVDEDGNRLGTGQRGELACANMFPSMPIGFWNDDDGRRYRAAYFDKLPGYWCHGDFVEITQHGGMIIYGRSDAVLNPGGVRIGTAEIYRQAEKVPEVLESIVVGQDWQADVRVVLFVRLRDAVDLDAELIGRIRSTIRDNATPRHVPAVVVQVDDIPRTKSGKIVELAVRDVIHHRPVRNKQALANPEALELFRDLPELEI